MEFLKKYKIIFLGLGFILIVIILGYLLYAVFFKTTETTPGTTSTGTSTTTIPGGLPTAGSGTGQVVDNTGSTGLPTQSGGTNTNQVSQTASGGITQTNELNQVPSLGVTLSKNGSNLQYYDKSDGKFYQIDENGNITALSDKVFYDVETVTWSPDKNTAILEYPDGSNIVYDFDSEKQITLPKHWEEFDYSNNGDQIVTKSLGLDPDNRYLIVANEDGSKATAIEPLGDNENIVQTSWSPNNQSIAMYTKGVDFNRQEVFFVGLNGENFKSMTVEGRDFRSTWSPEGDRLLYSVYSSDNDMNPMLWIVDAQGESIGNDRQSLGVETWADKCTFADSSNIYCAVPENLEEGSGLFPELALESNDNLYKIDTQTGLKTLVAIPDGEYNMSDLILSDNGKYLYFTDETTERIYKIEL